MIIAESAGAAPAEPPANDVVMERYDARRAAVSPEGDDPVVRLAVAVVHDAAAAGGQGDRLADFHVLVEVGGHARDLGLRQGVDAQGLHQLVHPGAGGFQGAAGPVQPSGPALPVSQMPGSSST